MADQWTTKQRNDLLPCPFCGTRPIERGRMANSDTATQWQISCSNPFCEVNCRTDVKAALRQAEESWQNREAPNA